MVDRIRKSTDVPVTIITNVAGATLTAGVSDYTTKGGAVQHVGVITVNHNNERKPIRFVVTGPYDAEADASRAVVLVRDAVNTLFNPNAVSREIPELSRIVY